MTTEWQYRAHIVVVVSDRTRSNDRARNIDPDVGGNRTFSLQNASATGQNPATHTVVSTATKGNMRASYVAMINGWRGFGFAERPRYWVMEHDTMVLVDSNVTEVTGQLWSMGQTLQEIGLKLIEQL